MIIDGKALAQKHQQELIRKIQGTPIVVSFCNEEDPPSVKYTDLKQKKAQEIGIEFIPLIYSSKIKSPMKKSYG